MSEVPLCVASVQNPKDLTGPPERGSIRHSESFLNPKTAALYRGTSLRNRRHVGPYNRGKGLFINSQTRPLVGPCLGFYGGPRGGGSFL